jgi:hypothetical protein
MLIFNCLQMMIKKAANAEKCVLDINLSDAVKVIHLTAPLCIENKLRPQE